MFQNQKDKDMLKDTWHWNPDLSGYKTLITKFPAQIQRRVMSTSVV